MGIQREEFDGKLRYSKTTLRWWCCPPPPPPLLWGGGSMRLNYFCLHTGIKSNCIGGVKGYTLNLLGIIMRTNMFIIIAFNL